MTIFGKHILHSWVEIQQPRTEKFYGKECDKLTPTGYRVCRECRTIQEYNYDSQGGWWWTFPECERQILFDLLEISHDGRKAILKEPVKEID